MISACTSWRVIAITGRMKRAVETPGRVDARIGGDTDGRCQPSTVERQLATRTARTAAVAGSGADMTAGRTSKSPTETGRGFGRMEWPSTCETRRQLTHPLGWVPGAVQVCCPVGLSRRVFAHRTPLGRPMRSRCGLRKRARLRQRPNLMRRTPIRQGAPLRLTRPVQSRVVLTAHSSLSLLCDS